VLISSTTIVNMIQQQQLWTENAKKEK
jgi:hypothetical protein